MGTTSGRSDLEVLESSGEPGSAGLAALLRQALRLPPRTVELDAPSPKEQPPPLGKYPIVVAVGDTLTREQTNEVMLRTNRWHILSCNDRVWNDTVACILGIADQLDNDPHEHESQYRRELGDGREHWDWSYAWELISAFGDGIKALKLFALDNESIMTSCVDGPCGWLDWSGRIRARYREGSKWTTPEEVEADWRDLAEAFPFLRLRAQLLSGGYLAALPGGTVGVEWIIENGTVTRVETPGKPLVGPERWWQKPLSRWYEFDWWDWKILAPFRSLYYWLRRRARRRWPHTSYWIRERWWEERCVSAARLIEAVDQVKETVMPDTFTVTEQHLKLLRRMNVGWDDSGKGAPGVDAHRPYNSKWVFHDVADILDPEGMAAIAEADEEAIGAYEQAHEEEFLRVHRETEYALDIALATGSFTPGTYRRTAPWAHDWVLVTEGADAA